MEVFNKFHDLPEVYTGCAMALGTFDGIHIGHVDIITTALEYARKNNKKCVVFSFSNHPLDEISPEKAPPRLCSEKKKKQLLADMGVDILFNMHFDRNFALLSSEEFVLDLRRNFAPGCIVVGDNYSYGYLGAGNARTLAKDGEAYGFSVVVKELVVMDGIIVNSSNIRKFIMDGDLKKASKLLGRYYSFQGEIIHGDARGRTLGFPTANMKIGEAGESLPADGIYAAFAKFEGKVFRALASIGKNPTFGERSRRLEVYIMDFDQDIYGRQLEVAFIAKIRSEQKFSGATELAAQIKRDVQAAGKYFDVGDNIYF